MFTAKPLMLLTSMLRLGDFDFREKKKYTENFIYSSEFRWKMRPGYTFEAKKPTKSASYVKSTKISIWSQNGTMIKFKQKSCLASQRNSLAKQLTINLKTNNYITNKNLSFKCWVSNVECRMLNDLGNVECWVLNVEWG